MGFELVALGLAFAFESILLVEFHTHGSTRVRSYFWPPASKASLDCGLATLNFSVGAHGALNSL